MDALTLQEIAQLVSGGGNVALLVCSVFIYKAADRLARIETALMLLLRQSGISDPPNLKGDNT